MYVCMYIYVCRVEVGSVVVVPVPQVVVVDVAGVYVLGRLRISVHMHWFTHDVRLYVCKCMLVLYCNSCGYMQRHVLRWIPHVLPILAMRPSHHNISVMLLRCLSCCIQHW
jgi:hypothetical protein